MNQDPHKLSNDILEGKVDITTLFPKSTLTPLNDENGVQIGIVQVNNRIISFDERARITGELHDKLEREFRLDTIGVIISHGQIVVDLSVKDLAYIMCQDNGRNYIRILKDSKITELIMMPPEDVDERDHVSYMKLVNKYLENAGVSKSIRGNLGTNG